MMLKRAPRSIGKILGELKSAPQAWARKFWVAETRPSTQLADLVALRGALNSNCLVMGFYLQEYHKFSKLSHVNSEIFALIFTT